MNGRYIGIGLKKAISVNLYILTLQINPGLMIASVWPPKISTVYVLRI